MYEDILNEYDIKEIGYKNINIAILQQLNPRQVHRISKGESYMIASNLTSDKNSYYLKNSILKQMRISNCNIYEAVFINCLFEDVNIKDVNLKESLYINCKFESTSFTNVDLQKSRFIGCLFADCLIISSDLNSAQFYKSNYCDINMDLDRNSPDYSDIVDISIIDDFSINDENTMTNVKGDKIMNETTQSTSSIIKDQDFNETYEIESNVIYKNCQFSNTPVMNLTNVPEFKDCTFHNMTFNMLYKISFSSCIFESCRFNDIAEKCFFDDCFFDADSQFTHFEYCNFSGIEVNDEIMETLREKSKDCYFSVELNEPENNISIAPVINDNSELDELLEPLYKRYHEMQQQIETLSKNPKRPSVKEFLGSLNNDEKLEFVGLMFSPITNNGTVINDNVNSEDKAIKETTEYNSEAKSSSEY